MCANTDPARTVRLFEPERDHSTTRRLSKTSGSHMGIDATRKLNWRELPSAWPELLKMDERVQAVVDRSETIQVEPRERIKPEFLAGRLRTSKKVPRRWIPYQRACGIPRNVNEGGAIGVGLTTRPPGVPLHCA